MLKNLLAFSTGLKQFHAYFRFGSESKCITQTMPNKSVEKVKIYLQLHNLTSKCEVLHS